MRGRPVLLDVSFSLGSVCRFIQQGTGGCRGLFIKKKNKTKILMFLPLTSQHLFLQNIELKLSFISFFFSYLDIFDFSCISVP